MTEEGETKGGARRVVGELTGTRPVRRVAGRFWRDLKTPFGAVGSGMTRARDEALDAVALLTGRYDPEPGDLARKHKDPRARFEAARKREGLSEEDVRRLARSKFFTAWGSLAVSGGCLGVAPVALVSGDAAVAVSSALFGVAMAPLAIHECLLAAQARKRSLVGLKWLRKRPSEIVPEWPKAPARAPGGRNGG